MNYQQGQQGRVRFEKVSERADYRGNRQMHVYLVVDGVRVAATKGDKPSASLMALYDHYRAQQTVENEDCDGQNTCAGCGATDYHSIGCERGRR